MVASPLAWHHVFFAGDENVLSFLFLLAECFCGEILTLFCLLARPLCCVLGLWCPGSVCVTLLQVSLVQDMKNCCLSSQLFISVAVFLLIFWFQKFQRENSEKPLPAVKESCQGSEEVEKRVGWSLLFCLSVNDAFFRREGGRRKTTEKKTKEEETIDGNSSVVVHRDPPIVWT